MISDRAILTFRNVVLALFLIAVIAGMLLPLYTDEVGWRLHERAGFDGVDKMFTRICGPNTIAVPPFWMMPVRYYSYLFNGLFADPFYVRVSGVLYALGWTALLLMLIRRIADDPVHRAVLAVLAIGLMSQGVMPLLLVWSRPEQPIILGLTAAMVLGLRRTESATPASMAWLRALAVAALALIALSYHIKAVFVMPIMLACLFFTARGPQALAPRIVAAGIIVIATVWGARYWVHRLDCPADAAAHAFIAQQNAGVELANAQGIDQILAFAAKALGNVDLFTYLGMPVPRPSMMSSWLLDGRIDAGNAFGWFLATLGLWLLVLILAAACLFLAARQSWRERRLDPRPLFAGLLVAAALGWSATQAFRNVYEASFVVPMVVLAVVLAITPLCRDPLLFRRARLASVVVGGLGMASMVAVAVLFGPGLLRVAGQSGYVERQDFSVSPFGYSRIEPDILAAAKACSIPIDGNAILIDDVTYFALMRSHMPEHRQGLFEKKQYGEPPRTMFAPRQRDPIAYLRSIGSDGAVLSCDGFPPEYQSRVQRRGRFCCMGPPGW